MTVGLNFYAGGPTSVNDLLVSQKSCVLYQIQAQNMSGGDRYLQLFDANAVPAAGAVPLYTYLIPTRNLISIQLPGFPPDLGRRFQNGMVAMWSTTQDTLTLPGAATGTIYASGRDAA